MKNHGWISVVLLVVAFGAVSGGIARAGEEQTGPAVGEAAGMRLALASLAPPILADAPQEIRNEMPPWRYNTDYLFALSRGLADSSLHAAAKTPLFIFTIPVDIVLFIPGVIGGFFG